MLKTKLKLLEYLNKIRRAISPSNFIKKRLYKLYKKWTSVNNKNIKEIQYLGGISYEKV